VATVNYCNADIIFKITNVRKTTSWIKRICKNENVPIISLNIIFCSDSYLLGLNNKFLNHNWFTDILSFDNENELGLDGELYISIPRVKENAKTYKQEFDLELRRVIAHGLLHLMGYGDKTKTQKAQMNLKENTCLELW